MLIKNIKTNIIAFLVIILFPNEILSEAVNETSINNTTWVLEKNGSTSRMYGKGQVAYHMLGDAYHTYLARQTQDWDLFSFVDSRNHERLIKGDKIYVLNEKSNKRILEVNLLSGPSKNRKMYILKEDLLKNFNMLDDEINENS